MRILNIFVIVLFFANTAFARESIIDDLDSFNLRVEAVETPTYTIHYPGYTIGGGAPPKLELKDCLLLDVKEPNVEVTIDDKMKLAQKIIVIDSFSMEDEKGKLTPVIKGSNVVFYLKSLSTYVTRIMVKSKTTESLNDLVRTTLPLNTWSAAPVELQGNQSPVSLLYIRGCRFF